MTEVNLNAGKVSQDILVQALDAKDGKVDGKISASVWNEFVKDKGGKTIKNFINSTNAEKSISTYLAKNSKISGKDKAKLAAEWFSAIVNHSSKENSDDWKKILKDQKQLDNLLDKLADKYFKNEKVKGNGNLKTHIYYDRSYERPLITDNMAFGHEFEAPLLDKTYSEHLQSLADGLKRDEFGFLVDHPCDKAE